MGVGSEIVSGGDTALEERNSLGLEGDTNGEFESVVTTTLLEDLMVEKALVAREKAANRLLTIHKRGWGRRDTAAEGGRVNHVVVEQRGCVHRLYDLSEA